MVHAIGPDPLLTCPLDESHRILKSRMQFHLVRCMKNHKLGSRLRCPWNPLHIVDKFAYEDHCTNKCEDMPQACESMLKVEPSRDVGSVPVTATNNVLPPLEEDWDAEPGQFGTYDPTKNAEGKMVLRVAVGLSKAKRKQWRQAERARFQRLEANGPLQLPSRATQADEKKPAPLRQPRDISRAMSSAAASVADDLNSSINSSGDEGKSRNSRQDKKKAANSEPPKLRMPRETSPAMYRATTNRQFENTSARRKNSVSSNDDAIDDIPNLCNSFAASFSDVLTSRRSSVSSSSRRNNNFEIPRKIGDASSVLLDEAAAASAADLPNLVSSIAVESDDASVLDLSQRIAELTTEQMKLDEKKSALMHELSMVSGGGGDAACVPNFVSYAGSVAHGSTHSVYDEMSNVSIKGGNPFAAISTKCAATFPKSRNVAARPPPGFGRGFVVAEDSFLPDCSVRSETGSGLRSPLRPASRAETNPFLVDDASFANISQLTYTVNDGNAEDKNSICGYGEYN